MFKKLKDKIAEEVKSSPQRIQQFAQAAQAAVTSASSSVSDITSNDLFSIGGDDTPQNSPAKASESTLNLNSFQDVSLSQTPSPGPNLLEAGHNDGKPTGRRLSNSSISSDVSFRLPSYESPTSMFHLQSDMDVSASETEDGRFTPGALDHVSKEQIFAAYKRSQERYNKYRGRYADLARHYRNLERENTKARAVLVETQDKALRRISELREQCALEQSAKAHLETALRMDLDEKNIKIESLTTKIRLLQSFSSAADAIEKVQNSPQTEQNIEESKNDAKNESSNLIDLSVSKTEEETSQIPSIEISAIPSTEISVLEKKVVKYEQLASKYMEALRSHKEKNTQLTTEIQIISDQLQKKINENEQLQAGVKQLTELRQQLQGITESKEEIQSTLDKFEKKKSEDMSGLQKELVNARNEIKKLNEDIMILNRKEEENAISLAENKLSVHKELEGKEKEIKVLKDDLEMKSKEIERVETVRLGLQKQISDLEAEKKTLNSSLLETNKKLEVINTLEADLADLKSHNKTLETKNSKTQEEMKRMELQLKQEVAEKLAMTDRNNYLENRNKQLVDENTKKSKRVTDFEKELLDISKSKDATEALNENYRSVLKERNEIQTKYDSLESSLKSALENYSLLEKNIIEHTHVNEKLQSNLNEKLEALHKSNTERDDLEERLNQISTDMSLKLTEAQEKLIQVESDVKEKLAVDMEKQITELETKMKKTYEAQLAQQNKVEERDLHKQIEELKAEIEKHLKELGTSKIEHNDLLSEKNSLESRIEQYEIKLAESAKQLESFNALAAQNKVLDAKLTEYSEQLHSLNNLKADHEQTIIEKQNLESRIEMLEQEKEEMETKADNIISEVDSLQAELQNIRKSHYDIVEEKNVLENRIASMENNETDTKSALIEKEDQINNLRSDSESAKLHNESLSKENKSFEFKLKELTSALTEKERQLIEFTGNNKVWQEKLSTILEDNNRLQEKCERLKQDKDVLLEKLQNGEQKIAEFETVARQYEESKLEKEFLDMRISQLESDLKQSNKTKQEAITEKESFHKEVQTVTADKKSKVLALNENISQLKAEVQSSLEEKKAIEEELNSVKAKLEELQVGSSDKTVLEMTVSDLKTELQAKESENVDFRRQLEELHLRQDQLQQECKEIESLRDHNAKLKLEKEEINNKLIQLEKLEAEYKVEMEELSSIRDERNRLLSDIEGLQAHLTKVSKDNSQLNDKIRELIASDASGIGNGLSDLRHNEEELKTLREENFRLTELQNRLEESEQKLEVISREKQDLERQLDAPLTRTTSNMNYSFVEQDQEIKQLSGKNKQLVQDKLHLESRVAEMELMSRSGDSNLRQVEQKNEKLRLMNEKLERRLDEALVSLRHFRSLEESTELEYLRNILYEYLTGPSTHSVTLAKVISAVVKFDDRQTDLVLQREKERQGLFGQLGLL